MPTLRPRHHSPAIGRIIDTWDAYDPWGSAMTMAWAVTEVATAAGDLRAESILEVSWGAGYPRSLSELADDEEGESLEASELAFAVLAGELSTDDLTFAARVLCRYLDLCKAAGLDY